MHRIGRLLDALDQVGPVEAVRRQAGLGVACVEIKFWTPDTSTRRHPRNCICSMAWRFYAIDATSSPQLRFDGLEAKGLRNNEIHCLISTQAET